MTQPEYDGDNALRLATEIDAALAKYGLGNDHRMCKSIHIFEGELRLIAECLRRAGQQKLAKQPPSTHGVATQEEIEKYLKQFKKMQISLPGTLSAWKSAVIDIAPRETPVPTRSARQAAKDFDPLFNLIYYPARNRR